MDLSGGYASPYACSVPAGITALQRLQHLGLRNTVTAPLPRTLSQLTCLTSLDVTQDKYVYGPRMFDSGSGPVVRGGFGGCMHTSNLALNRAEPSRILERIAVLMCAIAVMSSCSGAMCFPWCCRSHCHPRCVYWMQVRRPLSPSDS